MTHSDRAVMDSLKDASLQELTVNILPFWMKQMTDDTCGGFYGRMDGLGNIISDAPKGAILNARILWSFSAAYRCLNDKSYLAAVHRAKDYIFKHFFDPEFGGTYWVLNSDGTPLDTKKQIYSQAFLIYAFSECYRATGDNACLDKAIELFHLIEDHSFDRERNGYLEAFDRKWGELADLRLSEKDANEKKTMNTHLHILEAYTNLYRVWPDSILRKQLRNMVEIFTGTIIDPVSSHLNLFFDEEWNCRSSVISYGHDIEASWLLYEAAEALGDKELLSGVADVSLGVVNAASEGLTDDGGMIYERDDMRGHVDRDRHWWVQSEAVVGLINAWQLSGDRSFLDRAAKIFDFIMTRLSDRQKGEWFWSIRADGTVNTSDDRAGFWKCPYHNSRMCLEIMARAAQDTRK